MKINGNISNDEIEELILNHGLTNIKVLRAFWRITDKKHKENKKISKAFAKARGFK